eukprot:CFRG7656T1
MSEIVIKDVLQFLGPREEGEDVPISEIAKGVNMEVVVIEGAIKRMAAVHPGYLSSSMTQRTEIRLTDEGTLMADNGSHEAVVFNCIPSGDSGIKQADLLAMSVHHKIGINKALAAKWISMDKKAEGGAVVRRAVDSITDSTCEYLKKIRNGEDVPEPVLKDLKKRKAVQAVTLKQQFVKKGPNFSAEIKVYETKLTPEMIASGEWKNKELKPYNFEAQGASLSCGHLHPLLKVRSEFRSIFLEMGFSEMPTNNYVESSFWNFDALFQPQAHPARDAHDTFFIKDPANCPSIPEDYMEIVKATHENGGATGSYGYRTPWSIDEARKNIMRTHTTAVSARMLKKLADDGFKPSRMFSIDRVFRNETLDATHLAEFNQIEGVLAGEDISLAGLKGFLNQFFRKALGIEKLRFKPAYNPYTEPSMEIFGYHEGMAKWIEIGNSGMFRPEMLEPMGLPKNVAVLGFGLSLERPTMIKLGLDNIRDLFGHKVDMQMVYDAPACRLDKFGAKN